MNSNCVIVAGLREIAYFEPLVFWNIINFALFRRLVWVLGSYCVNIVLCLVFEFSVEMSELMTWSGINHTRALVNFILLFIHNKAFIWKYWPNIILFLFTSNKENFVLCLDGSEVLWKNISISEWDLNCGLSVQLVNKQRLLLIAVVVEPWFDWCQYVVWFKTNYIM